MADAHELTTTAVLLYGARPDTATEAARHAQQYRHARSRLLHQRSRQDDTGHRICAVITTTPTRCGARVSTAIPPASLYHRPLQSATYSTRPSAESVMGERTSATTTWASLPLPGP